MVYGPAFRPRGNTVALMGSLDIIKRSAVIIMTTDLL